jgi:endonuclease/exonuclease/phosphatase family metal-dependent hydrolase
LRRSSHSLVTGLLLIACLLWPALAGAESLELRLVSYNVYMVPITAPARAERLERLPDKIAELKPDVVMLQEVWSEADSASLERSLRDRGLGYVFRAASSAPFSYDSSGMIIASRYPITNSTRHSFSVGRFPHTPYHLDWIGKKGALDVHIETPLGPVRFVDTHFQASYETGSYESVRISQSLELASWLTDESLPLVVGGDFNARADSPSCRVFREQSRVQLPEGRWRVDQVLLRNGANLAVASVDMQRVLQEPVLLSGGSRRRLSDHRAVLMRLRVDKKPQGRGAGLKKQPFDPVVYDQATQVLRENLRRTRRQQVAGLVGLPLCLLIGAWGTGRVRKARRKKARGLRWALLALASVIVSSWVVYFLIGYVPHRQAGIERALVTLAEDAK